MIAYVLLDERITWRDVVQSDMPENNRRCQLKTEAECLRISNHHKVTRTCDFCWWQAQVPSRGMAPTFVAKTLTGGCGLVEAGIVSSSVVRLPELCPLLGWAMSSGILRSVIR